MANLTLRQLRYLDALARHGHFGRAADACAISQPALSMQIRELEGQLGVVLVERGPRQVRLTGIGEQVSARGRDILRAVDELGDLARAAGDRLIGRLRIGVIPTIGPYLLPTLITALKMDNPALELDLRETVTSGLLRELADGQLDAAVVALPVSEPSLTEVPLFDEHFVLIRPSADRDLPMPDLENLSPTRLLLLEEGHCFREQALSLCRLGTRPREVLEASSLSTLVQMVGAGIGITLIPEMAVPVETRSAEVCVAHFAPPKPQRTIGMIWRRTSPLERQLRQVAQVLAGAARGAADS